MMYEDDKIIVKESNIDKYGKGLYAKKDFNIGDIILVEEPFYILNEKNIEDENIKKKIFELKNSVENDNKTLDIIKIINIIKTNSISLDGNGSGLFTIISRINHSCISNARYFWNSIENKEYIIAVRDIKKDEEITVSYGETILMSYDERKQYLFNRWKFNCECLICKDNEIDLIKKKLKKLDDMISSLSLQNKFEIAFNCAEKMLELIKNTLLEEDLLFKNKIYYDMYQLLMYRMNVSKANTYLEKYLSLIEIIEKKNSQNYIKKKRYIKNSKLFMMDKLSINK